MSPLMRRSFPRTMRPGGSAGARPGWTELGSDLLGGAVWERGNAVVPGSQPGIWRRLDAEIFAEHHCCALVLLDIPSGANG